MTMMEPTPDQCLEWIALGFKKYAVNFPDGDGPPIGVIAPEVARLAYAAGADAELEACCEWTVEHAPSNSSGAREWAAEQLRFARRPKPTSLKQQAVDAFRRRYPEHCYEVNPELYEDLSIIARALESIPGD